MSGGGEEEKMWRSLPLPTSVMRRRMENYDDGIKSHRYFLSPSLSLTLPKDFDFLLENSWVWMQCCYNEGSRSFSCSESMNIHKRSGVVVESADSCGVKNRSGLCCWRYEWWKFFRFPGWKANFPTLWLTYVCLRARWGGERETFVSLKAPLQCSSFLTREPRRLPHRNGFTLLLPVNDC